MPSSTFSISLKNLRGLFQQNSPASRDCSAVAGILTVSKPVLAFGSSHCLLSPLGPWESTTVSTVYRNTSDAAQTFLPPLQGVAGAIPVVGGIIKAVIGGMLTTLQLVDRYIQNEDDMVQLTTRLHFLLRLIDIAPIPRTTEEENMRWRLLSALQTEQSKLEKVRKRIRGSSSVTQDIAGCISRTNNHLLDYMIFAHMVSQNEVHEIKANTNGIARLESIFKQVQFVENFMGTAGTGSLPASLSLGYATLVDATGREHPMLLDQCRNLDQLDLMLRASLHQCRPDEAKIQRWYIERGQYDFVTYRTDLDVIQLTKECNIWSKMEPGTTIVMRAIVEEETGWEVTARYKCPCGTPNIISVGVKDISDALRRGCTIICGHCQRRFQITRARGQQKLEDNTNNQRAVGSTPTVEEKCLIRNFLAKQVLPSAEAISHSAPGPSSLPIAPLHSAISDQYLPYTPDQDVLRLPELLNNRPISHPGLSPNPGHQLSVPTVLESSQLSSLSTRHVALNNHSPRPRTSNQIFNNISDLASHYGIPQFLPVAPRTTPRRTTDFEDASSSQLTESYSSSPDFANLCSNYLTMLSQKPGGDDANDDPLADAAPVAAPTDVTDAFANLCSNYLAMLSQKYGDDDANDDPLADAAPVAAPQM